MDTVASKLELARKFGATDVVNAKEDDPVGTVLAMTSGGVHHAFEAIGLKATAEQAFGMLKHGGTATVIGMIPPGGMVSLHGVDFLFEKKIQGSFMGSNRFRVDMPRFVDFYLQGKLHLDDMVSSRIKLSDVNDALQALENRRGGPQRHPLRRLKTSPCAGFRSTGTQLPHFGYVTADGRGVVDAGCALGLCGLEIRHRRPGSG